MWNVDLSPILASVCLEYIVESEIGHGSNQNGDIDRGMLGDMVRRLIFSRWGYGSKPSFDENMVQMKLIKPCRFHWWAYNLSNYHMNSWQVVSH